MKRLTFILFILLSLAVTGCSNGEEARKPAVQQFVHIATGGMVGTYFPLGIAVADLINSNIPGANASVQSTGASVDNINLMQQGKVDLIFSQNDILYYAENGLEMFAGKKVDGLRGIASLYPETIQIITTDKTITSINQLRGKRISVGPIGGATAVQLSQILHEYGFSMKEIIPVNLSFSETAEAFKNGSIDAAIITAGIPTAAIQDVVLTKELSLLSIDEIVIARLIDKYPFYSKAIIPVNTYKNQNREVHSLDVKAVLAANSRLDNKLVYNICKVLFNNNQQLKAVHPIAGYINKESALDGMTLPLAEGAANYYQGK